MALFEDFVKRFGGVFDFNDDEEKKAKVEKYYRPEVAEGSSGATSAVQPGYRPKENEFDKPLWITGASQNPFGSWSNDFLGRMFKQQDALSEKNMLGKQFSQDDATGVVTWDHVNDKNQELRWGDVFDNGEFKGNIYDELDENEANLLMSQLTIEKTVIGQIGRDKDPMKRLSAEINRVRTDNNERIPAAFRQMEFQKEVDKRQKRFGFADDAFAIVSSAASGALLTSKVTKDPRAIALGALAWGAGTALNMDDISEQAAAGIEITKRVFEDDKASGIGEGVSQAAGLLGRVSLSPISNIVRGSADLAYGNLNDGTPVFQNEDTPGIIRGLDIVAAVGDAAISFGSSTARRVFMTQMAMHGAASVEQLTLGRGNVWDSRGAEVDNVYSNGFKEALSAWGAASIDFVQLGMARGLANKINPSSSGISALDRKTVKGLENYADDAVKVDIQSGRKFFIEKDSGKVIGARLTSTTLAPSEGLQAAVASQQARKIAAKRMENYTPADQAVDDLYKASVNLAMGQNPMKTALVNAFGEGTEEAVQEVLDAVSTEHMASFDEIATAWAYGTAMGLGMSVATNIQSAKGIEAQTPLIIQGFKRITGQDITAEDVAKMDYAERRHYLQQAFDPQEAEAMKALVGSMQGMLGTRGRNKEYQSILMQQLNQELLDKALKNKGGGTNDSLRLLGKNLVTNKNRDDKDGSVKIDHGVNHADDAAPTSERQLLKFYKDRINAYGADLQTLQTVIAELDATIAERQAQGANTADVQERRDKKQRTLDSRIAQQPILEEIVAVLEPRVAEIAKARKNNNIPLLMQIVVDLNVFLDSQYRSEDINRMMAAGVTGIRFPHDNVLSYAINAPAIEWSSAKTGQDNAWFIPIPDLAGRGADFDGDRSSVETVFLIDPETYEGLATGVANLIFDEDGNVTSNIKSYTPDVDFSRMLADILKNDNMTPGGDPNASLVIKSFEEFATKLKNRYNLSSIEDFSKDLRAIFIDTISKDPIEDLMILVNKHLKKEVAARAMGTVNGKWVGRSNELTFITELFRAHHHDLMTKYNQVLAANIRIEANNNKSQTNREDLLETKYEARRVKEVVSSTPLLTAYGYAGTDSSLRLLQAAHVGIKASTDSLATEGDRGTVAAMIEDQLWLMAQMTGQAASDLSIKPTNVAGRVKAMAEMVVEMDPAFKGMDPKQAAFALLRTPINNINPETGEVIADVEPITVGQVFTARIVADIKRTYGAVIQRDKELVSKLDLLEKAALNNDWGRSVIMRDALGYFAIGDLLDPSVFTDELGWPPAASLENRVRYLQTLTRTERAEVRRKLESLEAFAEGTPGRAVIAELFEMANAVLAINDDGTLTGQLAASNESGSEAFKKVWDYVRTAMKTSNATGPNDFHNLINQEVVSWQIIEAVIKDIGLVAFGMDKDNKPVLRDWVANVFLEKDFDKAEMLLWNARVESLIIDAQATLDYKNTSSPKPDESPRKIKSNDTLAQAFIDALNAGDGSYQDMRIKFASFSSRAEAEKYFNTLGLKTPIMMYENNKKVFDPSLAKGGWVTETGSVFKQAMQEAVNSAQTFSENVKEIKNRDIANDKAVAQLNSLVASKRDLNTVPQWKNFDKAVRKAVANAGIMPGTLTIPTIVSALVRAFRPQPGAAQKAVAPKNLLAYATSAIVKSVQASLVDPTREFLAQQNGKLEIDVVRANTSLIFIDGVIVVDNDGTEIDLSVLRNKKGNITSRSLLNAMNKYPQLRPLIIDAVLPKVYAFNEFTETTRPAFTAFTNLDELVNHADLKAFEQSIEGSGQFTSAANEEFTRLVGSEAEKLFPSEVGVVERNIMSIAVSRIGSAKDVQTDAEIRKIVEETLNDFATAMREGASVLAYGGEALYQETIDLAKQEQQYKVVEHRENLYSKVGSLLLQKEKDINDLALDTLKKVLDSKAKIERQTKAQEYSKKLHEIAHLDPNSEEYKAVIKETSEYLANLGGNDRTLRWIEQFVGKRDYIEDLWQRFWPESENDSAPLDMLQNYLKDHLVELLNAAKGKSNALERFSLGLDIQLEEWQEIGSWVMGHVMQRLSAPVVSTNDLITPVTEENKHLFDASYSMRLNVFNKDQSIGVMLSEVAQDFKPELSMPNGTEKFFNALLKLWSPETSPLWTTEIANAQAAFDAPFNSASAMTAITLDGSIPKTYHAMARAAVRNTTPVDASRATQITVALKGDTVEVFDPVTKKFFSGPEKYLLQGAFVTGAVDAANNAVSIGGLSLATPREPGGTQFVMTDLDSIKLALQNAQGHLTISYFSPFRGRNDDSTEFNSLYFDGGMPFKPVAVFYDSLISELVFGPGGLNEISQKVPLKAIKEKLNAFIMVRAKKSRLPNLNNPREVEKYFLKRAQELVDFNILGGNKKTVKLGNSKFRAALKLITMTHVVKLENGDSIPVDQYFARVYSNDQATVDSVKNATLVPLGVKQTNSLYGEAGTNGLLRQGEPMVSRTSGQAFSWDFLTASQKNVLEKLKKGPITLPDSKLVNVPFRKRASAFEARLDDPDSRIYKRLTVLKEKRRDLDAERSKHQRRDLVKWGDTRLQFETVSKKLAERDRVVAGMLATLNENTLAAQVDPGRGPAGTAMTGKSIGIVVDFAADADTKPEIFKGRVSSLNDIKTLENEIGGIGYGDAILIDVDNFEDPLTHAELLNIVNHAADKQLTIRVFGKGTTGFHIRNLISTTLTQRHDYEREPNRPGVFNPRGSDTQYAAFRAYESRAFEQGPVSSVSRLLRFSVDRRSAEAYNLIENEAYMASELGTFSWHNTTEKLQSSVVYNEVTVQNQDRLITELRTLFDDKNPESVKILDDLKKAYGKGFYKAINDLKARVARNHIPKKVGDELFEGMIIPMIVESPYDGGVPSYYLKVLGSESTPDGKSEMGDYITSNRHKQWFIDRRTKNKNQSLFPGTIMGISINERGDTVYQTSVALQELANKVNQGTGFQAMKWLLKLLPERLQPIFGLKLFNIGAGNQPFGDIHIVSYGADDAEKLAEEKSILNTRELFATFGTDQRLLWYEGLYNEKYVDTEANRKKMSQLLDWLEIISETQNNLTNDQIHNLIQDMVSNRIIEDMLTNSALLSIKPFAEMFLEEFKNKTSLIKEAPAAKLALASAIIYLSGEQHTLNDIRSASGFIHEGSYSSDFASRYMPNAYTQIFDLHTGKDSLRSWAVNEVNSILNVKNKTDGWTMLDDYRLQRVYVDEDGKVATITGVLSHGVIVARGEQASSPDRYGQVQRDFSLSNQIIGDGSVGGDFSSTFQDPQFAAYVKGLVAFDSKNITGFEGFNAGIKNGTFNADAFRKRKSRNKFLRLGLAEKMFKGRARDDLNAFFERVDFSAGETAKDKELQEANKSLKQDLANELFENGEDSGHYIDYMIRLMMGRPGGKEPGAILNQQEIALALNAIKDNIRHGFSPMYRGMVAWVPAEIRRALAPKLLKGSATWRLMYYNTDTNQLEVADTLEKIDLALYDHAFNDKDAKFDPAFALTISAIYHQYLSAANDTLNMPVSLDFIENLQLLAANTIVEKEINEVFIKALKEARDKKWTAAEFAKEYPEFINASLSSAWQIELTPQAAHNLPKSANLAMILGSSPELKELFERTLSPQEELREYAHNRMSAWRKDVGAAYPVAQTARGNQRLGTQFQDSLPDHTPIIRSALGISAALRLNSPPLAVAGAIEGRMRNNIFQLRKLLTGESTGMLGMWWIKLLESDSKFGVLLRGTGAMTIYTEQDAILKRRIASTSATISQLREIIHEELDYLNGKMYEKTPKVIYLVQKWGNALQDLARGTRSKTATNAYLDAALASIAAQGGSIPQVLARLSQDGAYIAKQKKLGNVDFSQAHAAGIMAINDLRATQQTALNMVFDFPKRKIKESGNVAVNSAGALLYTMPFMFTRYATNFALTTLGLRGFDQLAAVAIDGRKRGKTFMGTVSKAVTHRQDTDFVPPYDMSEVTDGLDIMNSFVDMGLTHGRLFLAGLIAGSLGLSGEDEETKRRRRLAEAQGAGFLYDPRQIENDFRNAEAVFLNWLPDTLAEYFRVTPATYDENGDKISDGAAMANLHWTVKPFFSPIIGMEKFFNTGDIRQIWWGFHDAFTSMPIVNSITLNKAHSAAAELTIAAEEASMGGDVNGLTDTASFLAMMVGNYEYLLMESSFVNSLYVAFDEYDRNPYVLPLRNSDRELQGDIEGNVRPNDLALEPFINEDGKIEQGYRRPSQGDATLASMTENRATLAIIASLFTGFTSDSKYWRYNMSVKTRTVDKPEMDIDKAKAAVLGGFVSNEEVMKLLNGETPDTAMNDASASRAVALSFLNEEGNEVLTNEGAMALYRGIVGGTMPLGSENMGGIYIPMEMRKQIQVEWLDELTEEGVKLGLSESAAKNRAKKVWYGSDDGSVPGIADILFDKDLIPYDKTTEYQQLNTTYILGPDGKPWATGFKRSTLSGALGFGPLTRSWTSGDTNLSVDSSGNTVDPVMGVNLGMRAMKRVDDSANVPTDKEIGDAIVEAIENLNLKSGFGGYGGYGGGGGGGYAQRPYSVNAPDVRWLNLNTRELRLRNPYANDIYAITTENVALRRFDIRRERISSERGRLNQWQ